MSELRRLLIDSTRLGQELDVENRLPLSKDEQHYLLRVLRLRTGDPVGVVDGMGNLWESFLFDQTAIQLTSTFEKPLIHKTRSGILVCMAVVLPKRGFEDVLRMGCEIGVDIFQPLSSERRVSKGISDYKVSRWNAIVRESVEQSERLWMPELLPTIHLDYWLRQPFPQSAKAIATTRLRNSMEFHEWLEGLDNSIQSVWLLIGPEGGWSNSEVEFAMKVGCEGVTLGENILRTSTASIVGSQFMVTWRRVKRL